MDTQTAMDTQAEFTLVISVDDHTVEPPDVWRDRLPAKYRDTGPRIVRAPLKDLAFLGGRFKPVMGAPGDDGPLGDWWVYEDLHRPLTRLGPFTVGALAEPLYVGTPAWDVGRRTLTGSAEALAESLRAYRALGVDQVQVRFRCRDRAELTDQMAAFGAGIAPHL